MADAKPVSAQDALRATIMQMNPAQLTMIAETIAQSQAMASITDKDVDIVYDKNPNNKQITIPDGMQLEHVIIWAQRKLQAEESVVEIREVIDCFVLDGAWAFAKALARIYGFAEGIPIPPSMFRAEQPPKMVGLEIDINKTVQVPWGRVQVPGIEGYLQTNLEEKDNRPVFVISGQVKKKHESRVAEIAALTREIVRKESAYRGRAIRFKFPNTIMGEGWDLTHAPKFLDLSKTRPEELIFSDDVRDQVETNIFTLIECSDECRKYGVPLKRGILLEGPYGTGKTMTAYVTALKAVQNGWTFIYLEKVSDLAQAIMFAQQYQPAVIFAEDVDRVVGEERGVDEDAILNTIDGISTKSSEIMVVLTTNHVENINQAMLRPGRLDSVISVRPPDAKACTDLVHLYARDLLPAGEDLSEAGRLMADQQPAFVREAVERSKLTAIRRRHKVGISASTPLRLAASDLVVATKGLKAHFELLAEQEVEEDDREPIERAAQTLADALEVRSNGHAEAS